MCGIAGIIHYDDLARPVDAGVLAAMTRSLAHRGPDGEGIWSGAGVGLGHRRLAILDLSENGRQPMFDPRGELVITYNGEVYNFRELRAELAAQGHVFRSTSDTEVILAGYRQWGADVVARLSGIFAFAIWDVPRRRMLLARDQIGVKPLFYSDRDGTLRFGSEIKAILSDAAVDRSPDDAALDAFLTHSYTPAPATGFAAVRQLLPGHLALVDERGMRVSRYWECPYPPIPRTVDFQTATREFTELLDRVVAAQMVSDVPLGAFLSGGLDSAAIVRAMQRAGQGPVHALTVGFDARGYDEREGARQTAVALQTPLEEQEVSLEAAEVLPRLSLHCEEPTADSSMLAVYYLCRAARRRFTVAMSGDGADELLAGYETYRATSAARAYRRLPGWMRRNLLAPLARRAPLSDRKYNLRQVATRFVDGAEQGPERDHCSWRVIFNSPLKQRLYSTDFMERTRRLDPLEGYVAALREAPASREPLARLLNADTSFYLPNDMLIKVDRMSMANSLEVRVPLLDIELVRFCAALPGEFKLFRGKVRKHILRESLRASLPEAVLRRPKSGFNIPLERWMRESLGELLLDALGTRHDEVSRYLRVSEVERLVREHRERTADHAHALFTILMFALWLDNRARAWRPSMTERSVMAEAVR